jgi:hypothetical protein
MNISEINSKIQSQKEILLKHSLYEKVKTIEDLHQFLECHVYAVWDFMSLLKALQSKLTCTTTPWFASSNPETRYLINEIVLAEESDLTLDGKRLSHFEMYVDAMNYCGAHTEEVDAFLKNVIDTKNIFIPTMDMNGMVSWGEVSAITRHDPGTQLYEIKTYGGRKVIVTESKSLLIWKEDKKMFEEILTPDIKLGDFLPVTVNLTKPCVVKTEIELCDYLPNINKKQNLCLPDKFELNEENGIFIGLFLAEKNTNNNKQSNQKYGFREDYFDVLMSMHH